MGAHVCQSQAGAHFGLVVEAVLIHTSAPLPCIQQYLCPACNGNLMGISPSRPDIVQVTAILIKISAELTGRPVFAERAAIQLASCATRKERFQFLGGTVSISRLLCLC